MISLSISEIFSRAWQLTKQHLAILIGLWITLMVVPNVVLSVAGAIAQDQFVVSMMVTILVIVLQILMQIGIMKISFGIIDGQKPQFADLFKQTQYLVPYIGASLLMGLLVAVLGAVIAIAIAVAARTAPDVVTGLLAVVLVGGLIYLAMRLFFAVYIVVDQDKGPIDALKLSVSATKGHVAKIFGVLLLAVLINLLGALLFGLGLLITVPLTFMVYAVMYRAIAGPAVLATVPKPTPPAPTPNTI